MASFRPPSPGALRFSAETRLTGQILIAMPSMGDSPFARSVILVCAHDAAGAMGIVINQPIEKPSIGELLQQLELPNPTSCPIQLCAGGPVDQSRGFVLHSADWNGDGSLHVSTDLTLTASLDVLKAIAEGGGPKRRLLALGYAGWAPGQLDQELADNVWISTPAPIEFLFGEHPDKWRTSLKLLDIDPASLSPQAGHA